VKVRENEATSEYLDDAFRRVDDREHFSVRRRHNHNAQTTIDLDWNNELC